MATLIAIPILVGLAIFQSTVVSRITLLHGTADLVLLALVAWTLQERVKTHWQWCTIGGLLISILSAMPFGVFLVGYLMATVIALILRRRVWKVPILAMFTTVFLGTLLVHALSMAALWLVGNPQPFLEAIDIITLPSLILNLLLAIPMFILISDLAKWLYPEEIEV
jgi:rod shape-determining protein MreD